MWFLSDMAQRVFVLGVSEVIETIKFCMTYFILRYLHALPIVRVISVLKEVGVSEVVSVLVDFVKAGVMVDGRMVGSLRKFHYRMKLFNEEVHSLNRQ